MYFASPSLVQLLLAACLAASAAAQSPGGYGPDTYGPGGGRSTPRDGGGRRGPRPGGMSDLPTPAKLAGPPTPVVMRDTVGLSAGQVEQYAVRYGNHMRNTAPVRDSLRNRMQEMRAGFENGDRSAARDRRSELEGQWKELSKRDKQFDKDLKDRLSKDQAKRYEKWKKAREKADQDLLKEQRSRRGGGQAW
jgi:hypothetical protein